MDNLVRRDEQGDGLGLTYIFFTVEPAFDTVCAREFTELARDKEYFELATLCTLYRFIAIEMVSFW